MKRIIVFFIVAIGLLNPEILFGQCTTPNLLAWFKTTSKGWEDFSGDKLNFYDYRNENCSASVSLNTEFYSVNYNPALVFRNENDNAFSRRFYVKDNRSSDITIIAVLIPHNRDTRAEQYSLSMLDQKKARIMDKDYVDVNEISLPDSDFDYGYSSGSNLLATGQMGDPNFDKYGKIVTYQTVLRQNRTFTFNGILNEIMDIFDSSDESCHIPEILVFDQVLSDIDRLKAETYLAVKFGISKEDVFLSCGESGSDIVWNSELGATYNWRKNGIAFDTHWDTLAQSRSNSYYDEIQDGQANAHSGRFSPYGDPQDYSHHRRRMLTIGIQDESSDISKRWSDGSYNVWGSNNKKLEENNEGEITYINRVWRMESHYATGTDKNPILQWCNFMNMSAGEFKKTSDAADMYGIAASTTGIESCGEAGGNLSFSVTNAGSGNNSIIGFSSDNMQFVNQGGSLSEYKGFTYAIMFTNNGAFVRYDLNGDGFYDDHSIPIGSSSSYTIHFERDENTGNYVFWVNDHQAVVESHYPCLGSGGVFAKMILKNKTITISDLTGVGFGECNIKGTNVEFSYDRVVEEVFNSGIDLKNSGLIPVLLIDKDGDDVFNVESCIKIRGGYSLTPRGYGDKIEFTNIKWDEEINDLFTLGFVRDCYTDESVTVDINDCCALNVTFSAQSCFEHESIYYQFLNEHNEVVAHGCARTEDLIDLGGDFANGSYTLNVYFSDCSLVTVDVSIQAQILPDELKLETFIENGIRYVTIVTDNFPPDFNFYDHNLALYWDTPYGQIDPPNSDYPDGWTIPAPDEGTYTALLKLYCDDNSYCEVSGAIVVEPQCEYTITESISQCCKCNYLTLEIEHNCPPEFLEGAIYSVFTNNNILICNGNITGNSTEIPLCNISGNIIYEIELTDGTIITGNSSLPNIAWENIDILPDNIEIFEEDCINILDYLPEYFVGDLIGGVSWMPVEGGISNYGKEFCPEKEGCYILKISGARCNNQVIMICQDTLPEIGNYCELLDTFCVTFKVKDPCDDITINFDCGDEIGQNNNCFEGANLGQNVTYMCIENIPEECNICDPDITYVWNIYSSFGISGIPETTGEFKCCKIGDNTFIWVSAITGNLEPGNYYIMVDFEERNCICNTIKREFTINENKSKYLLQNFYCSGEQVALGDTLNPQPFWCIDWKQKKDNEYRTIQSGRFDENKRLNNGDTGNYLVEIVDCETDKIIEYNYFTILDCAIPIQSKLNVHEIVCSDDDKRLQLDMQPDAMLEKSMFYDIWTLTDDSLKNNLIYRDKVYYGIPAFVYYIPAGLYWMDLTNFFGQVSGMFVRVTDYHRLPAELIYQQNYILSDQPFTVDAGVNVTYDADYIWTKNDQIVGTDSRIEINSEGVYKVEVSTRDCAKRDSINVQRIALPLTSVFENKLGKIDLEFNNPGALNDENEIFIINDKEQEYVNLEVYTLSGKMVYSAVYNHIKDYNLNINFKKSGIYFIRALNSKGEHIVKKLIIQ